MRQFPSNLSASELRAYRRWTCGLYLSYLAAIIVAVGLIFVHRPASDLKASNETQIARSEAKPINTHAATGPANKP